MFDQDFFNKRSLELAPLEAAARIWHEREGTDPDVKVRVPHPAIRGAFVFFPLWLQIAEQMNDWSKIAGAMKAAHERSEKKEPTRGNA